MFARHGVIPLTRLSRIERCVSSIALMLVLATAIPAHAQGNFDSGSTGADGAFNPPHNFTLQIPESGILNFTTITIDGNLHFRANSRNTPITMLATGNVTISGDIFLNGGGAFNTRFGGAAAPGGFRGGDGGLGFDNFNGTAGDGPGGGLGGRGSADHSSAGSGGGAGYFSVGDNGFGQNPGQGGPSYGTRHLLPLIGGSGGGGGSGVNAGVGGGGGGGGGAILIASSSTITFTATATINASGGGGAGGNGAGGSGGAIRLIANTITGSPGLFVNRGFGAHQAVNGSAGYIRVEAFDLTQFFFSSNVLSQGQPNLVMLPNMPQLRIASVGGIAASAQPSGSFHTLPDIVVPTSQPNPVTVAIEATNIPLDTVIQLTLTPDSGARTTINSTPLAGSEASSNATASVTLPTTGLAVITATTTYDVVAALGKPLIIEGERVVRAEVAATFGGRSTLTYITHSGKRIRM